MKKSLLAVAVAAALPGVALAQSNVTLSGYIKLGAAYNNYSAENGVASTNGTGLMEGSSRIIFAGSEDLGGGNSAIWQMDQRFKPDNGTSLGASGVTPIGGGNTFVGLKGGWGTFKAGRHDLFYGDWTDGVSAGAPALQHWNYSILGYVGNASPAIANGTRTQNVLAFESAAYSGFSAKAAYTFSPFQQQEYMAGATADGKGNGAYLALAYAQGPLAAGVSYWQGKNPTSGTTLVNTLAGVTATVSQYKQEAYRVGGTYDFGVAKVGLTYDNSAYWASTTGGKIERAAWALPVSAPLGKGTAFFTYTSAGKVKNTGVEQADTGASMLTVAYDYPLGKRTSVGASVASIRNQKAASYAMFTGASLGDTTNPKAGQDVTSVFVGIKHSF